IILIKVNRSLQSTTVCGTLLCAAHKLHSQFTLQYILIIGAGSTAKTRLDVRKFKETKKQFDKVREDMDLALVKNAQATRSKTHEVEEATGMLTMTRKCFRHLALDYVLQINVLQAKKKFEILDSMLSFMHAQYTFFKQGYDLLNELDPYMRKLATELDQLVIDSAVEKREMEHKHALIQQRDFSYDDSKAEFNVDAPNGVVMEGYLFKRASNAFKTWNRRWFSIQNSQLVYQKKMKDALTVVVEDLRLCSVKPCEDIERRFCFEVVSPNKSCMLQADSEKLRLAWIQAVQASIATAYRERETAPSPSTSSIDSASESRERGGKGDSILQRVQGIAGNEQCCDCGQPDPRWASINLGITLCIECSGIHRSLGVQCSKVRSLTLDSWEPELLKLMCELGNNTMNQIYESKCGEQAAKKPQPGSTRQEKETWIKAKYVEKKFLKKLPNSEVLVETLYPLPFTLHPLPSALYPLPSTLYPLPSTLYPLPSASTPYTLPFSLYLLPSTLSPQPSTLLPSDRVLPLCTVSEVSEESSGEPEMEHEQSDTEDLRELHPGILVYKAAHARNLAVMAEALAHGADVNWVNDEDENKTPLIQAVIGGSLVACEFLLQNGADVNQKDIRGRGPIHHGTYLGHTGQVCLFLKRGASQNAVDEDGQDPLSIAVQAANADIVTLLRLARMNEEMREAEGPFGQPGDETYLDIFREFSHMASNNPEKLNRRSFHFSHSYGTTHLVPRSLTPCNRSPAIRWWGVSRGFFMNGRC
uniref:Arf-GAP with coiled-coil, ANK repeat and PH domain-containing protein n=1 Tax=Callorhinchus milii TaxID=7868 RepID=A0A4W3GUD9_CALMI